MKKIISRKNQEIKSVTQLQSKKYRLAKKQFIAEGVRVLSTLIQAGHEPSEIYVLESMINIAQDLVANENITIVTDEVMQKISTSVTPSGIVGVFNIPPQPAPDQLGSGIVLVNMADPGNIGTLIRTCAAMNYNTVVCVKGTDPYNPKVIQATAGSIGLVNIFQLSWDELLKYKHNYDLYALVVSGGNKPSEIVTNNALLVIGSEAHGIPDEYLANCEYKITIPMPGKTESLNAAVAGSIALYLTATN